LLLLEHPPIFTIGRTGSSKNILCDTNFLKEKNVKVSYVDRGGDITFHGEGQLVTYPIFNLHEYKCDLHKYLRALESVVIDLLGIYNIKGERLEGYTGVWVGASKIASIGVGVRNWVTYHGLSLNVNVDLDFFSQINPCGISQVKMTSLKELLGRDIPIAEVKSHIVGAFERVFNLEVLN